MALSDATREELAYLAGIVDGEGSIGIGKNKSKPTWKPRFCGYLCVSNTSMPLVEWIADLLGGTIIIQKAQSPLSKKKQYLWKLTAWRAVEVIRAIRPYLIIKARRADAVCELYEKGQRLGNGGDRATNRLSDEEVARRQRLYMNILNT